uniref:Mitochondrial carrier protein n=1 Tax=Aureoumbra lagunensis TaxID=44058 RepID=A0A7S3NH49_9STRA
MKTGSYYEVNKRKSRWGDTESPSQVVDPGWPTVDSINSALRRGILSGLAGASAMMIQVSLFIPVDTLLAVQYRYGESATVAWRRLIAQGYGRFYCGIFPALIQGPAARFGDTASNATVLNALDSARITREAPTVIKTTIASGFAAAWRVFIIPVDVSKTLWQIYGPLGPKKIFEQYLKFGVGGFYFGSLTAFSAAFLGHLPWYCTFNSLDQSLPTFSPIIRNACLGFTASFVSDSCTNCFRVLKAIRQAEGLSYTDAIASVVKQQGVFGLLTRGLKTRIIANGIQGIFFTVLWRSIESSFLLRSQQQGERKQIKER